MVKILSVDDEAPIELLMRQYFRRKIRNGEYEFYFAHNGLEALDVLANTPDIEIILCDINMPEMDGLTLLAKVNEMHNPAMRVIMVSAYGDMKNISQAMNNGAFDFATKPIDILFMVLSQTVIRSKATLSASVAECLRDANHLLSAYSVEYMFVTVFYLIYNTKTGLVTYCNAGHNPPHVLRADGTIQELPRAKNLMMGAIDGAVYTENTLQLEHGDALVMFTDGVTEAMNLSHEEFGTERLDGILRREGVRREGVGSREIVEAVKAGITDFVEGAEQHDDITMLVLKRK